MFPIHSCCVDNLARVETQTLLVAGEKDIDKDGNTFEDNDVRYFMKVSVNFSRTEIYYYVKPASRIPWPAGQD